jgi:septal ring factor EnvC (AmiA/AmiB activator)
MTRDEMRGHVGDVLATPLSDDRMLQELQSRVNGADLKQVLVAALAVAREQVSQKIDELERARGESEQDRWRLEDGIQELQEQIKSLTRKCEPKGKAT